MSQAAVESWAAEIAAHLKERFGLAVSDALSIDKGWLNVKWRMMTDRGPVFVKYYHPERYKLHAKPERRRAVAQTLRLQQGLSEAGTPCPKVHTFNDQYIQETPSGLCYALLEWVDGHSAEAGNMNAAQMYALGAAAGRMHRWLRDVPPLDKPAWEPDREKYLKEWQGSFEMAQAAGDETVLEWLRRSRDIVTAMDFGQFDASPAGWLHWDLWTDNILLRGDSVAGIVDFDRMTMAYPEIDAARALLSGALRDGGLQMEEARSFAEGYREHSELPEGTLSRAMRMLYLVESIWWLRTDVRAKSELVGLLRRFVEEIHWIEEHWEHLPELLDRL
ncbi:phosphotransferase [Paenibacillus sp. N4]|uniref:phosphotransferase enzyme family protein n=1 Tax=Paenibacillus vietnamensis TaxID=2590547 RepID=UPI001CD0850A|nr:phosphotransferase [Paenibacillus vietnamensis]MCA0757284.1 phosphotransferase [Paenibacillus vietnamensis]